MNVQTELPDHPKYLRLKKQVGNLAMEYLVRLWAHCQDNQRGGFWAGADAEYVELVCRWDGKAGELYRALEASFNGRPGWIVRSQKGIEIHDWETQNLRLHNSWKNGRFGGRKPNQTATPPATEQPRRHDGQPTDNPRVTQREGLEAPERVYEEEREERERTRAREGLSENPDREEPVIPTLEEVQDFGNGAAAIPSAYCLRFWNYQTHQKIWLNRRGELIDWRGTLTARWATDRATWKPAEADQKNAGDLEAQLQTETDPQKRRAIRAALKKLR